MSRPGPLHFSEQISKTSIYLYHTTIHLCRCLCTGSSYIYQVERPSPWRARLNDIVRTLGISTQYLHLYIDQVVHWIDERWSVDGPTGPQHHGTVKHRFVCTWFDGTVSVRYTGSTSDTTRLLFTRRNTKRGRLVWTRYDHTVHSYDWTTYIQVMS